MHTCETPFLLHFKNTSKWNALRVSLDALRFHSETRYVFHLMRYVFRFETPLKRVTCSKVKHVTCFKVKHVACYTLRTRNTCYVFQTETRDVFHNGRCFNIGVLTETRDVFHIGRCFNLDVSNWHQEIDCAETRDMFPIQYLESQWSQRNTSNKIRSFQLNIFINDSRAK